MQELICLHYAIIGAFHLRSLPPLPGRVKVGDYSRLPHSPSGRYVIHTNTAELRSLRKLALELLLSRHDQECKLLRAAPACRSWQALSGAEPRFNRRKDRPVDESGLAIVRDRMHPLRRMCAGLCQWQGIGVLSFSQRADMSVSTA